MEFVNLYNNHIEPKLITDMAFCKDWGGKYHGLILRLCGIIHCVKCVLNNVNPANVDVGIETFCNAVEIGEYYREQAIYAYSLGDVDTATLKAERVIDRIRAKNIRISGLVNSVKSTICHFMVCIVSDTYLHRFL